MTNEIQWKDGSVCYAYGKQQYPCVNLENFLNAPDFQLNEIRTGDFIAASELDTEQKYNDVVEVFGFFGFVLYGSNGFSMIREVHAYKSLACHEDVEGKYCCGSNVGKRQLTYQQIMTIGKLKRMSDEKTSNAVSTVNRDIERNQHKTSKDYLAECMEVQSQRGEQFNSTGTGERSFSACADAYNAITGGNLKGSDVCLILQILKDVRQYSNPERLHEDSMLDKVSYSSLHAEELSKEHNND